MTAEKQELIEATIAQLEAAGQPITNNAVYAVVRGSRPQVTRYMKAWRAQQGFAQGLLLDSRAVGFADVGRVSDVHFGLAALHALVDVTAGTKPRNDALSLSFSRKPQHDMESGQVHIGNTTAKTNQ